MAIKYLSGKRLQGTAAERTALNLSAPPQTSWKELGRTTLGSAGATIDVNGNTWNLQVGAEISSNRFKLTSPSSPPYAQIAKELDSTVDGDFCLRFRIKWHSGDSYAYFGLTDEEPSSTTDSTMDSCMAGFYFTAGSNRGMRAHAAAASSYAVDPIASTGASQTGVANTDYYIELSRDVSAETLTLKKYTASDYTGTPETHTMSSTPSGIDGLKYLKGVYSHDGATGGASAHVLFDQIKLYKDTTTATGTVFYEELLSGFTAKDNLMILSYYGATATSQDPSYRLNGDTNQNYARRGSSNGSEFTVPDATDWRLGGGNANQYSFDVGFCKNIATQEKLITQHGVNSKATGTSGVPDRMEHVVKWANTSDQITTVNMMNVQSGGTYNFTAGSEVVVLGYDDDEADSGTNFWQELASVDDTSNGNSVDTGTFAAKKYLMIQAKYKYTSGNDPFLQFNGDTDNNYIYRRSMDGGSESNSGANGGFVDNANTDYNVYDTIFIVNESGKEKIGICHTAHDVANTGANNLMGRREFVGKWTNTSDQITSVQYNLASAGDITGSIKVWGAD